MAGKDRKKQLARQRYERQQQRKAAEAARARRVKVVGAAVAVALIAGGGAVAAAVFGGDGDDEQAAGPGASPAAAPSAKPGECAYPKAAEKGAPEGLGTPPVKPARTGTVKATLKTNVGDVKLALDADKAPCTVNSMVFLAQKNYFDKTECHRLVTEGIKVLQCGDPTGTGSGGPGYSFANENTEGATYERGTLAMANAGPGTNGSQFFIVYGPSQLSPDYTVFGEVTGGLDVVDAVAKAGATAPDASGTTAPKKKVTIKDVTLAKK